MADEFDIRNTIGFSLHHASYVLRTTLKAALRDAGHDVTTEEMILLALIPTDGLTQQELLAQALKDKTQLTRLLDRLVEKGWVSRKQRAQNRREQEVRLTAKGKRKREALIALASQVVPETFAGVSAADLETTRKTLNRLLDNAE